jgi:hypothetical protein
MDVIRLTRAGNLNETSGIWPETSTLPFFTAFANLSKKDFNSSSALGEVMYVKI